MEEFPGSNLGQSIEEKQMIDCIFCKIVKKEVPAAIIYEDDFCLVMLDIKPVNKGHCLVITKEHYENLFEISEDRLKKLISVVQKTAKALKQTCDGVTITQNNGKASGQIVNHIHFHVIPRYSTDVHKYDWKTTFYADEKDMKNYVVSLSKRMDSIR